jgi:hypothetical protein
VNGDWSRDGEAEKFYRELKAEGCRVLVGMEATGHREAIAAMETATCSKSLNLQMQYVLRTQRANFRKGQSQIWE